MKTGMRISVGSLLIACLAIRLAWGAEARELPERAEAPVKAGVIVCVDAPPGVAAWAAEGRTLVQVLMRDDAGAVAVRAEAEKLGVTGLVSAQVRPALKSLPYASHLVDVLVVDDWDRSAARGLTWTEAQRVVAPGGRILTGGTTQTAVARAIGAAGIATVRGDRVEVVLTRPSHLDEQTHPLMHDAGGTRVGRDNIDPQVRFHIVAGGANAAFKLYEQMLRDDDQRHRLWVQWIAGQGRGKSGSNGGMASAGRVFLEVTDTTPQMHYQQGQELEKSPWYLVAHDAWNGLPLWTRVLREGEIQRRLAMNATRVYLVERGQLVALDAETGAEIYATGGADKRVFGTSVVLIGKTLISFGKEDRSGTLAKSPVIAVEAATGMTLWQRDDVPEPLVVADGTTVVIGEGGGPRQRSRTDEGRGKPCSMIVAVNVANGRELWRKTPADFGSANGVSLAAAEKGRLLVYADKTATVVQLTDGALVSRIEVSDTISVATMFDDIVAVEAGHNQVTVTMHSATTGKLLATAPQVGAYGLGVFGLGMWACNPGVWTKPLFERYLPDYQSPTGYHAAIGHVPVGVACKTGAITAGGLVFSSQQSCICDYSWGRLRGLAALRPVDPIPPAEAFQGPSAIEQGPAWSAPRIVAGPAVWPTFRGDEWRSGRSLASGPARLISQWNTAVTSRPATHLTLANTEWRARWLYGSTLTAPVIGGGLIVVGAVERGEVVALDERTGAVRWRFVAEGPIDTPPSFVAGWCVFGCRDGRVYCVDPRDGRLRWRARLAPVDEQIVVNGLLESRFPAIGAVLPDGDGAWAVAGLSGQQGVVAWRFNVADGTTTQWRRLAHGSWYTDVPLRGPEQGVWLSQHYGRLDQEAISPPVTGGRHRRPEPSYAALKKPVPRLIGMDTSILDTARYRDPEPTRSRRELLFDGVPGHCLVWNEELILTATSHMPTNDVGGLFRTLPKLRAGAPYANFPGATILAMTRAQLDQPAAPRWQTKAGWVWAMALTRDAVVVAGPVPAPASSAGLPASTVAKGQDPWLAKGLLRVLNLTDGLERNQVELPATVVPEGLAVGAGFVVVSCADGRVLRFGE